MSGELRIDLALDVPYYQRTLNSLQKDQLPFAVAATLTEVAGHAQQAVIRDLPKRFNLRSRRIPKGIRIKPASKRDWPRSFALVGVKDQFMADHERGGVRRATRGKYRAVPTQRVKRKVSGAVRRPHTPRRLIETGRGFFGDRSILLKGTRRTKGKAGVMFFLRRQVTIRARFGFGDTVQAEAARRIQPTFRRRLSKALRSSPR